MLRRILHSIFFIAVLVAAMSFNAPDNGKLILQFENYVGDKPLIMDTVFYKNSFGQSYTVSMFKYYVGNFHLKNSNGQEFISKGYFLLNQEDKNSMKIIIDSIPQGEYSATSFTLGVDSIDNCSGAQSGALDPINGMFWAWNTGYVFLKMEGKSPASKSTAKQLEFHIGGYKEPNNCIRIIHLKLNQSIQVKEKKTNIVRIKADVSHLFSGANSIDFSKLSSVTDYRNAKAIADNYSTLFSVIENQ